MLLKAAPVTTSESGVLEKVRTYFVLALVDADTKTRKQGQNACVGSWHSNNQPLDRADIAPQAITPRWPPSPESLAVEDGVYEVTAVPLTSIAFVTGRTIKVPFYLIALCLVLTALIDRCRLNRRQASYFPHA